MDNIADRPTEGDPSLERRGTASLNFVHGLRSQQQGAGQNINTSSWRAPPKVALSEEEPRKLSFSPLAEKCRAQGETEEQQSEEVAGISVLTPTENVENESVAAQTGPKLSPVQQLSENFEGVDGSERAAAAASHSETPASNLLQLQPNRSLSWSAGSAVAGGAADFAGAVSVAGSDDTDEKERAVDGAAAAVSVGTRPQATLGKIIVPRYVVVVFCCLYCLVAGPAFLNWTTIADMLYKADAFVWECSEVKPTAKPHEAKCAQQELAVSDLFTVASCSYFTFAMLGGVLLDWAGPKLAALSGLATLMLGWILLAFSTRAFPAYTAAMVFIGGGIDMAFFPCLCGANLFPGWVATVIAIYGAFRSVSFVIGLVLRECYFSIPGATLQATVLGYVCVGLGTCVAVAVLIIPWKAWPPPDKNEAETEEERGREEARRMRRRVEEAERKGAAGGDGGSEETKVKQPKAQEMLNVADVRSEGGSPEMKGENRLRRKASSAFMLQREVTASAASSSTDAGLTHTTPETSDLQLAPRDEERSGGRPPVWQEEGGGGGAFPVARSHLKKGGKEEEQKEHFAEKKITSGMEKSWRSVLSQEEEQKRLCVYGKGSGDCCYRKKRKAVMFQRLQVSLQSFVRDLISVPFIPLIFYFIFVLIDTLFYTPSAMHLIPEAYFANQIIVIFGFLPCIVFGYLSDRIGIIRVMMIANSSGLLAWVLLLSPGIPSLTVFQYIASVLFTVQMSFLMSQIYCYVTEVFSPENLGKLIGFLSSTGGLISFVTSPMRKYSVLNNFYPMVVLCLVLAAVNDGLLLFMFYWQKKTKRQARSVAQAQAPLVSQERMFDETLAV